MNISRRRLLLSIIGFGALVSLPAGCARNSESGPKVRKGVINLGPYTSFGEGITVKGIERLAIIRDKRGLASISMVCTHQECLLNRSSDGFSCPCHGAQFNSEGAVMSGPAKRNLERYQLSINNLGEIELDFSKLVDSNWRLSLPT